MFRAGEGQPTSKVAGPHSPPNRPITHLLVERVGEGGYQAAMDGNVTPSPRRVQVEHGLSGRRLAPDEVLEPVIDEEYQLLRRLTDYREPYRYAWRRTAKKCVE